MLELNAFKVTLLFPIFANDETAFPPELWSWWFHSIVSIGAYYEFLTEGIWEGRREAHRCVTMVIKTDEQFRRLERFLQQARERFGQDVMYFEATPVHFRLI